MRSGASTGQMKMWGSERGASWAQWSQFKGERWEQMCEWVRRVCPMRKRVRMILRRRDDWLDDGHGAVKCLTLAKWLSCCWLLHYSCHLLFITVTKNKLSLPEGRPTQCGSWRSSGRNGVLRNQ